MDERTSTYTASTLFLQTLCKAGITHAFVNWGSDHPALLEDLERQRVESRAQGNGGGGETQPVIVTCPNEMVALSAAQGFAQATGKPAAVIVHVDVGTQALAGAIHNVDRSRTPVLIYAGASPISSYGEYKGTRNEWIMWLQDIPDQTAIVRQYMRHTAQIGSAKTLERSVKRALQISTSEPKGPVYLWARREVMEEEVDLESIESVTNLLRWPTVEPSGLSQTAATHIALSLLNASSPLIITSHLGRSPDAVSSLARFASLLSIPVISTCPSAVNIPFSHPSYIGTSFLFPDTHWEKLQGVDVVLVLECEIPWIPMNEAPPDYTTVFVVDGGDPLKLNVGQWHVDAEMICRADPEVALKQLEAALMDMGVRPEGEAWVIDPVVYDPILEDKTKHRREIMKRNHARVTGMLDEAEERFIVVARPVTLDSLEPSKFEKFSVPNIIGVLRKTITSLTPSRGQNTLILNETISNYPAVWTHLRPEFPGSVISSGGSSLGWALGAAVGASLGAGAIGAKALAGKENTQYDLVVAIVGDGSYMFGVPSSAYWMAMRYKTPFLTIILNNGGWKSPKMSMLGVHPTGHGSRSSGAQLSVGFGPTTPDYSQIAIAASAGWAYGVRIGDTKPSDQYLTVNEVRNQLETAIQKAVRVVLEEKRCAVVDCLLPSI